MSLDNLLKIGQLETHQTDAVQIGRLLDAASRCLDGARQESITLGTRLEAGYRAIMQLSMLVLWANSHLSPMDLLRPVKCKIYKYLGEI
jgi:hypothetical protein